MKKWLFLGTVLCPVGAYAACNPSNAPHGSLYCMQQLIPSQSTDVLLAGRPGIFPNGDYQATIGGILNVPGSTQYMPFSGGNFVGPINAPSILLNGVALTPGGAPGGQQFTIQFNNTVFAGDPTLNFNPTTKVLGAQALAINSILQTFPTSGNLLGATDSQAVSNKTIDGSAIGQTTPAAGAFTNIFAKQACDLLAVPGCFASFSMVNRQVGIYDGTLIELTRDDSVVQAFSTSPLSGFVDSEAVHNFADGHVVGIDKICNNNTNCADYLSQPVFANMPLLGWTAQGWPEAIPMSPIWIAGTGLPSQGRWMLDTTITGLPGPVPQTMYFVSQNINSPDVETVSSSSANPPAGSPTGDVQGDAMAPELGQSFAVAGIPPATNLMSGLDIEAGIPTHLWGAYQDGYAQLAMMIKSDSTSLQAFSQILTSDCVPILGTLCQAATTYQGTSAVVINPAIFGPAFLRLGLGTDGNAYGGRFTSWDIVAHLTTDIEDSNVLNNHAGKLFPDQPSACGENNLLSTTGPLTATNPTAYPGTPQNFIGRPVYNSSVVLGVWGTAKFNQHWNNQLFDVHRADTTAPAGGHSIYAAGCETNLGQLTTALNGTSGTAFTAWDQSGHNIQFMTYAQLTEPPVNPTGVSNKPGICFTGVTDFQVTASIVAGSPAGRPGLWTVTATAGVILPGMVVAQIGPRAVVLPYGTGGTSGTGNTGTYMVTNPSSVVATNESMNVGSSPYMITQRKLWGNAATTGLLQNMTVEGIFQTGSVLSSDNPLISQVAGWWIGTNGTNFQLSLGHNGAVDVVGPTFTPNEPHYFYVTVDNGGSTSGPNTAGPLNVSISVDGGAPVTAQVSNVSQLSAGDEFLLGMALTGNPHFSHAGVGTCVAEMKISREVVPAADLLNGYNMAHAEYPPI